MQTTFQKLQEKFFRRVASSFVNHVMIILFSFTLSLKNTLFPFTFFYKYDNVYPQRVSLDISDTTNSILDTTNSIAHFERCYELVGCFLYK